MPTYEYRCPECGQEFEQFQRMSDEPVAPCPECGAESERLISAGAGLLFKGEGFYITDYRSASYKKKAEKEAGGSASGDATSSGTSDKASSGPSEKTSGGLSDKASGGSAASSGGGE